MNSYHWIIAIAGVWLIGLVVYVGLHDWWSSWQEENNK
jgi:hypothetical protein